MAQGQVAMKGSDMKVKASELTPKGIFCPSLLCGGQTFQRYYI